MSLIPEEQNFVIQFADGDFLQQGEYHGFVLENGCIQIGRTCEIRFAEKFTSYDHAEKSAVAIGISEPYRIEEIEMTFRLKYTK